jgi:hypothetical protein
MPKAYNDDTESRTKDADLQTWPSFVDVLSSTVVVLAFALLILIIVLSVSKQSSSSSKDDLNEKGGSSSEKIQSVVMSNFKAEFQKLAIVANPSLRKESAIQESDKTVDSNNKVPEVDTKNFTVDSTNAFSEVGQSKKQIMGDIPKIVDTKAMDVLKELLIVQKDVIDQQRKVIEQQEDKLENTVKEYQSLLSLVTKEQSVEDIRQKIIPREQDMNFVQTDGAKTNLTGTSQTPKGNGNYVVNPMSSAVRDLTVVKRADGISFVFNDNAQFLNEFNLQQVKNNLSSKVVGYKTNGAVLEAKPSNYVISGAEAQRVAVERLLIFRSILIELGVDPSLIKLKTIKSTKIEDREEDYGWVSIK